MTTPPTPPFIENWVQSFVQFIPAHWEIHRWLPWESLMAPFGQTIQGPAQPVPGVLGEVDVFTTGSADSAALWHAMDGR